MRPGPGAPRAKPCATWPRPVPRTPAAGEDDSEQRIPADRLRPGHLFVVRPGERIAAYGTVLSGESAVDAR